MSPLVKATILHFVKLTVLGAVTTLLAGLLVYINAFSINLVPQTYQVFVAMLIPILVSAISNAKSEADAALAQEQAAKAQAAAIRLGATMKDLV
jgi:multisubunit Na+/H+ antiporter MnhG subunit